MIFKENSIKFDYSKYIFIFVSDFVHAFLFPALMFILTLQTIEQTPKQVFQILVGHLWEEKKLNKITNFFMSYNKTLYKQIKGIRPIS